MSSETLPAVREAAQSLAPTNLQGALVLSERLAASSLIPVALRGKPQDVLVVLMKGHELGLAPMQALSSIHVISGKAVCEAALMVGLCLSRPDVCLYFTMVESDDTQATYETHRRGAPEPVRMSYTFEQAKQAKLTAKDNWTNHRAAMLRARASSALARAVYPDLAAGIYTPDEADEFREAPAPRASRARRVPEPVPDLSGAPVVTGEDVDLGIPGTQEAAHDQPPEDENVAIGTVTKLLRAVRTGKSAKGPWTLHTIELEGGQSFGTFSSTDTETAAKAMDDGVPVRIVWKLTAKGNPEIVKIGRAF